MEESGSTRYETDMCLGFLRRNGDMTVMSVNVDVLLVTASNPEIVEAFFNLMNGLSIKDVVEARKFLGMMVNLENAKTYTLDQQAAIDDYAARAHGGNWRAYCYW
uniref:AlNc14C126G6809 protein n=1 Tax=Albugo laibachii Nc14 TaxID=890382 RepID=F0WJT9_9STRA|nr:AlNc14C126G6809 [Albugo laibachii Nc14]|eukprot:CCA21541.1 AlNc14C126G6809 [Albugo laibachii Nc14]